MKKIVIAFGLVILLLGGALAAVKALKLGPFEETASSEPTPEELAALEAERKKTKDPAFVTLDTVVINVFSGGGVAGNYQFSIKLEVEGTKNATKVRKMQRRLLDAYLRDLHTFLPRVLQKNGGNPDLGVIQKRLRLVSDQATEPGLVRDVLIQSLVSGPQG